MAGKIIEQAPAPSAPVSETASATEVVETKAEAFKRLGKARLVKACERIAIIGNLSSRGNYDYTEEQVAYIMTALRDEVDLLERQFAPKSKARERTFEL